MKIGITYTGSEAKQQNYLNWLGAAAGDLAGNTDCELITLHTDDGQPDLQGFDGLVFSGGIDVHPSLYKMNIAYPNAPELFNSARDEFETELYLQAIAMKMPVLGICRGMQLINVLSGGTLKQDLGEEKNRTHRAVPADKSHDAKVEPGTMLYNIIHAGADCPSTIRINSAHHQVLDQIGSNLRVTCYSADGEPEALEWISKEGLGFLLCVQWHPERMYSYTLEHTPASAGIRKTFLQEVKSYNLK